MAIQQSRRFTSAHLRKSASKSACERPVGSCAGTEKRSRSRWTGGPPKRNRKRSKTPKSRAGSAHPTESRTGGFVATTGFSRRERGELVCIFDVEPSGSRPTIESPSGADGGACDVRENPHTVAQAAKELRLYAPRAQLAGTGTTCFWVGLLTHNP